MNDLVKILDYLKTRDFDAIKPFKCYDKIIEKLEDFINAETDVFLNRNFSRMLLALEDIYKYEDKKLKNFEKRNKLIASLGILDDREIFILTTFYGLDGITRNPLEIIAEDVGLTRVRVKQIKDGCLRKLYTALQNN